MRELFEGFNFKEWYDTTGSALIPIVALFVGLYILIKILNRIEIISKKEASYFRSHAQGMHTQIYNNYSITLGGINYDFINLDDKTMALLRATRFIPVLIFCAIVFFAGGKEALPIVLFIVVPIVVFQLYKLLASLFGKGFENIDNVVLKQDSLEIKLLDKAMKTQPNEEAFIYDLRDIDIKYYIKKVSRGRKHHKKKYLYHYIYLKHNGETKKFFIKLDKDSTNYFKNFIRYTNILKHNIDIEVLSDDELKKVLKSSRR